MYVHIFLVYVVKSTLDEGNLHKKLVFIIYNMIFFYKNPQIKNPFLSI